MWVGARGREGRKWRSSTVTDPLKPVRAAAPTGPVTAIARGPAKTFGLRTDGRGAFHLRDGKPIERFTFVGTGGALRSDHVYGVFVDAEEVVWFATDKGVCRYDPNAARTEAISSDANANYVRALWRTSKGSLLAGTNAGLFCTMTRERHLDASCGNRPPNRLRYQRRQERARYWLATSSGLFASARPTTTRLHADRAAVGKIAAGR